MGSDHVYLAIDLKSYYCVNSQVLCAADYGVPQMRRRLKQDYKLPDDIIEEIGLETFDFDTFSTDTFEADTFAFDTFSAESIQPDSLGITMLRRGVIGVSKIGYVS